MDLFEKKQIESPEALAVLPAGTMSHWTEEKKADFVRTFEDRTRVAQALLYLTADKIASVAIDRKFISRKHMRENKWDDRAATYGTNHVSYWGHLIHWDGGSNYYSRGNEVAGRSLAELCEISDARAEVILKELPPLKKAVEIIDPDTSKKIGQIDKLKKKGQELKERLDNISEPIVMRDLDQDMTIGKFREMVTKQNRMRDALIRKMDEISDEGRKLEDDVAKRLYKGLPGLSAAVVDVIKTHLDRAKALDTLNRRVEEEVKFGDCVQATEMLATFEKDEPTVSGKVKAEFTAALEKLRVSARKPARKQLKAKPKGLRPKGAKDAKFSKTPKRPRNVKTKR